MAVTKVGGTNPIANLINRQIGNDLFNFREKLYRERLASVQCMYRRDLVFHYGCVNAIEFSADGELLVSGGDDKRVLLCNLEKSMAGVEEIYAMKRQHASNIFCLGLNNDKTVLYSGGNDEYLVAHDSNTCEQIAAFRHTKPVYGLSVDPINGRVISTACEDGHVYLYDIRSCDEPRKTPEGRAPYHAVHYHPYSSNLLATANSKEGAELWDLRDLTQPLIRYNSSKNMEQTCMSVRFNSLGTQLLALRRRLPPILFNTLEVEPICQFYHPDYYNSCTMKSCSFVGGDDEYVISGSDDFNLYMWRIADALPNKRNQWVDETHMVLWGHRSIVNQARYNKKKCILATSGVEKVIKLWRPFESENWDGDLENYLPNEPPYARTIYSNEEYARMHPGIGHSMTHDYSLECTEEDQQMMAFFDMLVQRELESWKSDGDDDTESDKSSSSSDESRQASTLQSESDGRESSNNPPTPRKYINRIAFLIGTKRNKLKEMALQGCPQVKTRRVRSVRKCQNRLPFRHQRRTPKRINRINSRARDNGNNSDNTELPRHLAKRRHQSYLNIPAYRHNRRPTKGQLKSFYTNADEAESSSTDIDDLSDNSNHGNPSTSQTKESIPSTSQTNLNNNDNNEELSAIFPIPSTSTGFRGNGSLYRVIQVPDSDDEPTPSNSPTTQRPVDGHVEPPKLNGSNGSTIYSSGVDDNQPNEVRHSRRKRNHSLTKVNYHYRNYSSHSSSRRSNSSSSDDKDNDDDDDDDENENNADNDATNNNRFVPSLRNHLNNKKPRQNGNNDMLNYD